MPSRMGMVTRASTSWCTASGSTIRQTAIFDPVGLLGLAYWYAIWPLHQAIFAGMLRNLARAACEGLPVQQDDTAHAAFSE